MLFFARYSKTVALHLHTLEDLILHYFYLLLFICPQLIGSSGLKLSEKALSAPGCPMGADD